MRIATGSSRLGLAQDSLQRIQALLGQVPGRGLAAAQALFCAELGYEAVSELLPWPTGCTHSQPRAIARYETASGALEIAHVLLDETSHLQAGWYAQTDEYWGIRKLLAGKPDRLLVASDRRQQWCLLYAPRSRESGPAGADGHRRTPIPGASDVGRPNPRLALRGIRLAPEHRLWDAAQRVAMLDVSGSASGGCPPALEAIRARLELAFDPQTTVVHFLQALRRVLSQYEHQQPHVRRSVNWMLFLRLLQEVPWWGEAAAATGVLGLQDDVASSLPAALEGACAEQVRGLLSEFDFSVHEPSPWLQWVALDPSIMSIAYERLGNSVGGREGRSAAGVFFTPQVEVELMCRLALVDWLANHLGEQHKPLLCDLVLDIEGESSESTGVALAELGLAQRVDKLLRAVRVLDPACGCGSFLIGMYSVLHGLHRRVDKIVGREPAPAAHARQMLQHNLHGVEISDLAAEITRMRLFLALLASVHDRPTCADMSSFAANLAAHVRCGDSLLGPFPSPAGAANAADMLAVDSGRKTHNTVANPEFHRFDIILGNPPYVRQERLRGARPPSGPRRSRQTEPVRQPAAQGPGHDPSAGGESLEGRESTAYTAMLAEAASAAWPLTFGRDPAQRAPAFRVDSRSDLLVYFFLRGLADLDPKGTLCFVTSSSWLDAQYGQELRRFLLTRGLVKMVIDNRARRSFADAKVNTVIVLLGAAHDSAVPRRKSLEHIARFVSLSIPFEQALQARLWSDLPAEGPAVRDCLAAPSGEPLPQAQDRRACGAVWLVGSGREGPVPGASQGAAATPPADGCRVTALKQADLLGGAGEWQTEPAAGRWGATYLRSPAIYPALVQRCGARLVRLGSVATIRRGITTGANDFFFLDARRREEWGIEPEFLIPAAKTPRDFRRVWIDPDQEHLPSLFVCARAWDELLGTAALEYIKMGQSRGFDQRPMCRSRLQWWTLRRLPGATVHASYLIDSVMRFYASSHPLLASDNFQEVYCQIAPELMAAACNSTVGQLAVNVQGRASLGRGLLKLQTYEVKELLIPDPRRLPSDLGQLVRNAGLLGLDDPQRQELDAAVYDTLGLTSEEQDSVGEAVRHMVESRLAKAASLHAGTPLRRSGSLAGER